MAKAPLRWEPPSGEGSGPRLKLYNSLVDDKVPFVPAAGPDSKQISWYSCGPTVYDSAHMGHARNYVTFDVIRRVLEDYFGYNILYVMNVTDVDDKIILRARRNHLLEQYRQQAPQAAEVAEYARTAVDAAVEKQARKVASATEQASTATDTRQRTELEAAAKNEAHKLEQLQGVKGKLGALLAGSEAPTADAVLAVASDAVAEALDAAHGAGVADPSIFRQHAAKYEREFMEDMDALGVRRPDVLTRVCEFIPQIVAYVERIIANGMAYEAGGSVYFDTQRFRDAGHVYGKCRPSSVGCAALAAESESNFESREKRSSQDFALWKAAKPGEPSWESPWGRGRPGWHIECSAMASAVIGARMDIHSGGEDLKFPHHDNELAQSEAHYHTEGCTQWVNYFLHSGHLEIEGLKMSKSLKNFVTIREALTTFSARQLRLMFLLQPWGRTMNYGEQARSEMRSKEGALRNFFSNVEVAVREAGELAETHTAWAEEEFGLSGAIAEAQARVHEALCDNIATHAAMDALFALVRATNLYLAAKQQQQQQPTAAAAAAAAQPAANGTSAPAPAAAARASGPQAARVQPLLLMKAAAYVTRILAVFGVVPGPVDSPGLGGGAGGGGSAAAAAVAAGAKYLDVLAGFRDDVRRAARAKAPAGELLALCDALRDGALVDAGVRLEDRPDGRAAWNLDDPAVLRTEQEALGDKYSRFDAASGEPTHDAEGSALEGKAKDKARKDWEKAVKVREPLTKKVAEDPGFLAALAAEVEALREQLAALDAAGAAVAAAPPAGEGS